MPLLCSDLETLQKIMRVLDANRIETRRGYHPPLNEQRALENYSVSVDSGQPPLANTACLRDCLLFLPFFQDMSPGQVKTVRDMLATALN